MMSLRLQASSAHRRRQYLGGRLARCREVAPVLPAGHAREVEAAGSTSTSDAGSPISPFQASFSPPSGPQPQLLVDGLTKNQPPAPTPPPARKGGGFYCSPLQCSITNESNFGVYSYDFQRQCAYPSSYHYHQRSFVICNEPTRQSWGLVV